MRICRICLTPDVFKNFVDCFEDSANVVSDLFALFQITIVSFVENPAVICRKCAKHIRQARELQKICVLAEKHFQSDAFDQKFPPKWTKIFLQSYHKVEKEKSSDETNKNCDIKDPPAGEEQNDDLDTESSAKVEKESTSIETNKNCDIKDPPAGEEQNDDLDPEGFDSFIKDADDVLMKSLKDIEIDLAVELEDELSANQTSDLTQNAKFPPDLEAITKDANGNLDIKVECVSLADTEILLENVEDRIASDFNALDELENVSEEDLVEMTAAIDDILEITLKTESDVESESVINLVSTAGTERLRRSSAWRTSTSATVKKRKHEKNSKPSASVVPKKDEVTLISSDENDSQEKPRKSSMVKEEVRNNSQQLSSRVSARARIPLKKFKL